MIEPTFNIYEICKKFIGVIMPIGETNHDNKCYENLDQVEFLYLQLTNILLIISQKEGSSCESINKCSEKAREILEIALDDIQEHLYIR